MWCTQTHRLEVQIHMRYRSERVGRCEECGVASYQGSWGGKQFASTILSYLSDIHLRMQLSCGF